MSAFLAPLALVALTSAAVTPEPGRCQEIRDVRALAAQHGVNDGDLERLEHAYCAGPSPSLAASPSAFRDHAERRGPPSGDCGALETMRALAAAAADRVDLLRPVDASAQVVCSGVPAPRQWQNGQTAKTSGGTWYWPNGQLAISSGGTWYYPTGQLAKSNGGTWYWPSGQLARSQSGRWYAPNGQLADEATLLTMACDGARDCRRELRHLRRLDGDAHTAQIIVLVSGRERP